MSAPSQSVKINGLNFKIISNYKRPNAYFSTSQISFRKPTEIEHDKNVFVQIPPPLSLSLFRARAYAQTFQQICMQPNNRTIQTNGTVVMTKILLSK